ncbi:MAG: tetratricopeptide repeat protein [Pseudomonadota bacterium]
MTASLRSVGRRALTASRRAPVLGALLSLSVAMSAPLATAQSEPAPAAEAETTVERSQEQILSDAFDGLKSTDEAIWRKAEQDIEKSWSRSGSDSMDLLLKRGREAMTREETDKAIKHFTDLVRLAPDFAEGWNARATAHFLKGDLGASLADIAETLALEPRHFGALTGLGTILERLGDQENAIAAFRDALELHPHLEGPREAIERLAPTADGRDA